MAFEVYFGNAGVWERVVLEGSSNVDETIIKTSADSLRATVVEAGSVMSILRKTGSDALRPKIADASSLVSSGDTLHAVSDALRPTLTERAKIDVFMTRTDTLAPKISETYAIFKEGEGVTGVYGSGIYGSGTYGSGGGGSTSTTTLVTVNDSETGTGELQHNFVGDWIIGTGTGNYNSDDHYTSNTANYWTYSFKGTRLQLYGAKASHHGIASLIVDGGTPTDADYYSSVRQDQAVVFDTGTLPNGDHTVRLNVTGRFNPASTGTTVTIDRVDVESSGLLAPQETGYGGYLDGY